MKISTLQHEMLKSSLAVIINVHRTVENVYVNIFVLFTFVRERLSLNTCDLVNE